MFQLFEHRSQYVREEDKEMWADVTQQELMSDEEDDREGFKVNSPPWRAPIISAMCKSCDDRAVADVGACKKAPVKRKRVVSNSPMKRKPKNVKPELLVDNNGDGFVNENNDALGSDHSDH